MDDLISRQQAMALRFTRAINEDGIVYVPLGEYLKGVKSLPSAQQWIPCSERLPEEVGHYLITVKLDVSLFVTADDYFSYGWDDFGDSVIAWTPLPEPYKGEET